MPHYAINLEAQLTDSYARSDRFLKSIFTLEEMPPLLILFTSLSTLLAYPLHPLIQLSCLIAMLVRQTTLDLFLYRLHGLVHVGATRQLTHRKYNGDDLLIKSIVLRQDRLDLR